MTNPVAVVTGAGRGIGREIALGLAKRGLDVALLGKTAESVEQVAGEIAALGRSALALRCDVSVASEVDHAKARVLEQLGPPAVVVASAGVVKRATVAEMSPADWDHVIAVNLRGTFLTARAFIPSMVLGKKGRFVAVGSISGTVGTAGQSAYCASKWGVIGFIKSLAEELAGTGAQAMAVLPGSVDTDMLKGSGYAPRMTAAEVAGLVTYAALDAPDAMNGSAVEMFGA